MFAPKTFNVIFLWAVRGASSKINPIIKQVPKGGENLAIMAEVWRNVALPLATIGIKQQLV
jgi:hypothetical protein